MDKFFDLALGFGYIHIGLVGMVAGVIACLVSMIVWIARKSFLHALPSAFVVLALPPMVLGIIPGGERLAVPIALVCAFIAFYLHLRRFGGAHTSTMDKILAIVLGASLAAIVVAYALGSMSSLA